jgi:hypothetical protein
MVLEKLLNRCNRNVNCHNIVLSTHHLEETTLSKQFLTLYMAFTVYSLCGSNVNTYTFTLLTETTPINLIKFFTMTTTFIMHYIQKSKFHFLILTTDHTENSQTYGHYFIPSSICIMVHTVKKFIAIIALHFWMGNESSSPLFLAFLIITCEVIIS